MTGRISTLLMVAVMPAVLAGLQINVAERQQEVRARETAFARSMADRNLAAFTSFISPEAVFVGAGGTIRGPKEIAAAWKRFFDGPQAPFSWKPETVEVLPSGTLALSTGPVFDPKGERIGTYNSTWRLEADGVWRIIFDNGCP
jgi:ketosteroid isomerase-like protein